MKKLTLILLFSLTFSVYAAENNSFRMLENAVKEGKNITIVTQIHKCQKNTATPFDFAEFIGSYRPEAWISVQTKAGKKFITTSDKHFSLQGEKSLIEYTKYTFLPDNTLLLTTAIIDAKTLDRLSPTSEMICIAGAFKIQLE